MDEWTLQQGSVSPAIEISTSSIARCSVDDEDSINVSNSPRGAAVLLVLLDIAASAGVEPCMHRVGFCTQRHHKSTSQVEASGEKGQPLALDAPSRI
eukprot:767726-Hanusia_phi.AAC.6